MGGKPAKLVEALWPTLCDKIDNARWDDSLDMPPVADIVFETHCLAGESNSVGTWCAPLAMLEFVGEPRPLADGSASAAV